MSEAFGSEIPVDVATAPHPSALLAEVQCVPTAVHSPHNLPRSSLTPSDPPPANFPPSGPSSICPGPWSLPGLAHRSLLFSPAGLKFPQQTRHVHVCRSAAPQGTPTAWSLQSLDPQAHKPCEPHSLLQLLAPRPHTNLRGPLAQENTWKWSLIRRQGRLS